jgi:hypothetical protein
VLLKDLQFVPSSCIDDLLSCSLWLCLEVPLIGPGFSKSRASALYKAGLRRYRGTMENGQFIMAEAAQHRFGLQDAEVGVWNGAVRTMVQRWQMILAAPRD